MLYNGYKIDILDIIRPFAQRTQHKNGMSYGESLVGYDIRLAQAVELKPKEFKLASSYEYFKMPLTAVGVVHDKSTLARMGLSVFNTVIEPGWKGYLTLELVNHSRKIVRLEEGAPIAQVLFHMVEGVTNGYNGKYQDQPNEPVGPIYNAKD